jgi:hemolysin D
MLRALTVLKESLALQAKGPKEPSRQRAEMAFLPAALEIVETPPSPSARWMVWCLMSFFSIALLWSFVGMVDVIAVADGRTMYSGRSKVIQPAETGIVRAIHVRDGTRVTKDAVLIELDPTASTADRDRAAQELATARIAVARLRALLEARTADDAVALFRPPPDVDRETVLVQQRLMRSEIEEHLAKLAQLADELERKRAERATIETAIKRLTATIPLARQRMEARKELADKGFGSRLTYLETLQQLTEMEHEREMQRSRLAEADRAIASIDAQIRVTIAEYRRTKSADLAENERRVSGLEQELIKAEQKRSLQVLTSPSDGVVQQLAVHTVGGVVTPAQTLLVVVPEEDTLEVEARVLNRDIGFVRTGQEAQVKLETFNFTRYGLVRGQVISVSRDAIVDEKLGPYFAARVRLDKTAMMIDGRDVNLAPGLNATIEIKTSQRRVIEFLLSPLMRTLDESLRER